ncbi:MAG: hypothetical protein O9292_08365 [Rhodobacteraceae bacterium]|jgi:hypothetical protein|nr:hypothetical protein [Paracoccaceae bacterium]MCZ8133780.1 hypothetical protein [Paracoccaceae bacterium]MCZ8152386.1 hypothetical protein [Paracoccaceae bacterium]MCZ8335714.1 hypothetical protein [Paracoccaceae bacterium]
MIQHRFLQATEAEMYFFLSLEQQIIDGCIVDDEMNLARLAVLVPALCAALQQAGPMRPAAQDALDRAQFVIDQIIAEEEQDYS